MSFNFDPAEGLVIVRARLSGPSGEAILRLALDTGATTTLINVGMLVAIGYDPALTRERFEITTGSGVEFVPKITLLEMEALGWTQADFQVLGHTLPPSAGVDGLLGLDFLRRKTLTINFADGQVAVE